MQIKDSTMSCAPTHISINFVNYLDYNISGVSGKITRADLMTQYPKVYEYVKWVEDNQYWAGTEMAGKVCLLGTGAKRKDMVEIV